MILWCYTVPVSARLMREHRVQAGVNSNGQAEAHIEALWTIRQAVPEAHFEDIDDAMEELVLREAASFVGSGCVATAVSPRPRRENQGVISRWLVANVPTNSV